ncbi:hypothetical protein DSL72_008900 [Monilinia vaccinii-corymbosi]|uniref:Uncharacterized protein n=1 Tax=Monilinia vaccinii-corymbosi TaxID=61207 RepID=A0A8A3PSJ6_9HELO|nr:hypothetical protein DSL72_008900 [Monilinia vaccinii-corymbosi]
MSDDLLELGLRALRKNEDYSLEVQYLEEMFYTSDSPLDVLNELSHLQRDVQGDKTGYLRTCLTKYLCVADKRAMEGLSKELKRFDERNPASHSTARSIDAITRWGQRVIPSALCHHLGCPTQASAFLEEKEGAYEELPYDFKRVLAELGKREDGRESRFDPDDVDRPLPERFAEPCHGVLYRDGNFITCDSSGYFTRISPATNTDLEGGADA